MPFASKEKKSVFIFTQSCKIPFGCPFIDDDHGELAGPVGVDSQGTMMSVQNKINLFIILDVKFF
jgi:hypothetical protein